MTSEFLHGHVQERSSSVKIFVEVLYLIAGLSIGFGIGWLVVRARQSDLEARAITAENLLDARSQDEEHMKNAFKAVAGDVLSTNSETFLSRANEAFVAQSNLAGKDHEARKKEIGELIKPMTESLANLDKTTKELERERSDAYSGMIEHLKLLETQTDRLGKEARTLSSSLRKSSNVRGDWGEIALRNLLELAGMNKHTDFLEQSGIEGKRPDVIVRLPNSGVIPIDAKVSGKHYLEAIEEENLESKQAKLELHAKAMRERVNDLMSKEYSASIKGNADYVVMFVPSDALISAAFEVDPELHLYAMERGVLISSPVSMIALLRTAALYWQQVRFADDAREVVEVAQIFYSRMATWSEHFNKLGIKLKDASKAYNSALSSWQTRVLPQGKELEKLQLSENLPKKLTNPNPVETEVEVPKSSGKD